VSLEDRYVTATPEGVSLDLTLAGLGSRAAGMAIDLTIQIFAFLLVVIALVNLVATGGETSSLVVGGAVILLFALIFIGYFVLCEVIWSGRSIGKSAVGTQVVRVGGAPVTFTSSLLRNVARIVDWLPLFYAIGSIAVLVSTNNQRLGDMLGGTLVIRVRHASDRAARDVAHGSVDPWRRLSVTAVADVAGAAIGDPELASWDASAVTDAEVGIVRQFLARRSEYRGPARARLAAGLADRLRPKVAGVTGEYDDEGFLERLSMVRAARRS
jgi:uncharacterized RDD family membrane protein YckC